MNTIQELYDYFIREFDLNVETVGESNLLLSNDVSRTISRANGMRNTVVEKCFINIYLLWEFFLEKAFILYLCGKEDLQGNRCTSYVNPIDSEHAYQFLKGTKKYPDWTNLEDVNTLAGLFFDSLGRFSLLANKPIELIEIKTIRNKISHMSLDADEKFRRLVARKVSIETNITVADFLLRVKQPEGNCTYFNYYAGEIMNYVDAICNKPITS